MPAQVRSTECCGEDELLIRNWMEFKCKSFAKLDTVSSAKVVLKLKEMPASIYILGLEQAGEYTHK